MADFSSAGKPILLISTDALKGIKEDAAKFAGRRERGGILLGTRRNPHLHITEATLPMKWDIGSMFLFHRSSKGHQALALDRWRASDRTVDWVGEWHSHPQRIPTPSTIDLNSWRAITAARQVPMAFLIVGYEAIWLGMCIQEKHEPIRFIEVESSTDAIAYQPL